MTVARTKYLLSCSCGRQTKVDSTQAGLTLTCRCGAKLDVPTLRDLEQLPRLEEPSRQRAARESTWGPRQALTLVGLLVSGFSLLWGAYLYATTPLEPVRPKFAINHRMLQQQMDRMTLNQTFALWTQLAKGLNPKPHGAIQAYKARMKSYHEFVHQRRDWIAADVVLGVVGLVVIAVARFAMRPASPH